MVQAGKEAKPFRFSSPRDHTAMRIEATEILALMNENRLSSLCDHTPLSNERVNWNPDVSGVLHLGADSLFNPTDLLRLKELRPALDMANAESYREAGEIWLRVKADLPHGKFGQACQVAGYSARTAQIAMFIFKSGRTGKDLNKPINFVLRAIREGKRQHYRDQLEWQVDRITQECIPDKGIVVADSLTWLREQDTDSIPYFISDPPYGIGKQYNAAGQLDGWTEANTAAEHYAWFKPFWEEMCRCVSPGGMIVIWQERSYLHHFHEWFPGSQIDCLPIIFRGSRTWSPLVRWHKGGQLATHKGKVCPGLATWLDPVKGRHDSPEYYDSHPCAKNMREVEAVIEHYTCEGALVVDPFCGTGTTPAACKKLGRKFVAIEVNPAFAKLAEMRLEKTLKV